jgi:FAD dependent oxidoreductase
MEDSVDVVVVGGGIAGLSAAVEAARAGSSVRLVEAHRPGGRAQSDVRRGFTFNRGPHALYDDGVGRATLTALGVQVAGSRAPLAGARALRDGSLYTLPTTPASVMTTDVLPVRGRIGFAKIMMSLPRKPSPELVDLSARAWIERVSSRDDVAQLLRAFVRLSTYASDLDTLSADAAVAQLRLSTGGVTYLDGGWQCLVDGLVKAAHGSGVDLSQGGAATELDVTPSLVRVTVGDESVVSRSVVLAMGGPDDVERLLPGALPDGLGSRVEATCVDYGLATPSPVTFILGLDEPVYLSQHSPRAALAPPGCAVVCAMRYGSAGREAADGLDSLLALAGVDDAVVLERRVLASMTVAHAQPRPGRGLAGRPGIRMPGVPNCYLAGDWVGGVGLLADAALASGVAAGRAASMR